MTELLEHLGKDTLPRPLLDEFIQWCVWEQAKPALITVMQKADMDELVQAVTKATDFSALKEFAEIANEYAKQYAKQMKGTPNLMALSAAEAAAFEFTKVISAVEEDQTDAEIVAFFAARVSGWAGWATSDFTDPTKKQASETDSREKQEATLHQLWLKFSATEG